MDNKETEKKCKVFTSKIAAFEKFFFYAFAYITLMKNLSSKLRNKRMSLGLSQRALAKKIGVTSTSISQWEREENIPKGASLFKLANVLDVSIEWLTNGELEIKQPPEHNTPVDYYPNVYASGGAGSFIENEVSKTLHIPKAAIRNSSNKNIKCIHVSGDSMAPLILEGAIIGIDIQLTNIVDGHFYVFDQEGHLRVKELRNGINQVLIHSINPNYDNESASYDDLRIIGKVKWISNFL
ncbi:S24 family peptidase [Vibrio artabrorum]|uniref:S24 family peptidase n=1 Tax=Vibrio artabrorum TaxID=446374 RepID=UPI00354B8B7E